MSPNPGSLAGLLYIRAVMSPSIDQVTADKGTRVCPNGLSTGWAVRPQAVCPWAVPPWAVMPSWAAVSALWWRITENQYLLADEADANRGPAPH